MSPIHSLTPDLLTHVMSHLTCAEQDRVLTTHSMFVEPIRHARIDWMRRTAQRLMRFTNELVPTHWELSDEGVRDPDFHAVLSTLAELNPGPAVTRSLRKQLETFARVRSELKNRAEDDSDDSIDSNDKIRMLYGNGWRYFGEVDAQQRMHGVGLQWSDDHTWSYRGDFKAGQRDGLGDYAHGLFRAEGEFSNANAFGRGRIGIKDQWRYEGDIVNTTANGEGRMTRFDSGVRITGSFNNGVAEGHCVAEHRGRSRYEGRMSRSQRHGYGHLTSADGKQYWGTFERGRLNGFGASLNPSGTRYDGHFANFKRQGPGMVSLVDGTTIEGLFDNDKLNGRAVTVRPDGTRWVGEYKDNKPCEA